MKQYEVPEPILNSPYKEPEEYWHIVEAQAAERWVRAVNADGMFGEWSYAVARQVSEVGGAIDRAASRSQKPRSEK